MVVVGHSVGMMSPLLGAAGDSSFEVPVVVTLVTIVGGLIYVALRSARGQRRVDALLEEQGKASAQMQVSAERDQRAYAQHVALNDLTAEKIKLENQYLQLQVRIGQLKIEAREHNEEYHRLMSQKTQLEIQSLKLHIREQHKRLDDYTGFNDE
jgi:hypothetical protein